MPGTSSSNVVILGLLSVAVLLALLLSACGAEMPTGTVPGDTSTAETPQYLLTRVKDKVAELRRLEFLEPVQVEYVTPQQMTKYLQELMGEDEREELRQLDGLLSVLGLIGPDVDLVRLYLGLLSEGVVGAYNPEDGRLVVRLENGAIGSEQELTLAHELTHALQQQHFDIHHLLEEAEDNFDRGLAVSALAEGDATLLGSSYLRANMLPVPQVTDTPLFENAPQIIQDLLLFPYRAGVRMLTENFDKEDWAGINTVYASPPQSTEQVMTPRKYMEGDSPLAVTLPIVDDTLGDGWASIYSSVGGEFLIRHYLDSHLSTRHASRAASGWGGDTFALYEDTSGARLLLWAFRWDSIRDAGEFFDGVAEMTEGQGDWTEKSGNGGSLMWGRQGRWVHIQRSEDYVSLIMSPSEVLMKKLSPLMSRS